MLEAVPLEPSAAEPANSPEQRAKAALEQLEAKVRPSKDVALLSDHLSLLRRWYYRPEKQRVGEVFLPNSDGSWPARRILRGAARQALGEPKSLPEVDREGAKKIARDVKTRVLHEGRPDVERVVPLVGRQKEQ
jgi:hypothetical protein